MVDQICGGVCQEIEGLVEKIPFVGGLLGPLFQPGGTIDYDCDTSLDAYLLNQIEQQCQGIASLNPKQV